MPDVTGPPVTLDGTAVQGAAITVINHDTGAVLGETTTDTSGNWAITVSGGQTVHVLAEYEDADGNLYQEHSKPFVVVESSIPTYIQNKGVFWIKMGEGSGTTAFDELATHDAAITGAVWTSGTWVDGWALDFDGVDDSASITHDAPLNMGTGNFSVAATIGSNRATTTSSRGIAVKYRIGGTVTPHYGMYLRDPSTNQLRFRARDSGSVQAIPTATVGSYPARAVAVRNGDTFSLYINNTLAASETAAVGSTDNTDAFNIGRYWTTESHDGLIDDVLLCNQALTEAEITEDYNRQPWTA